MLLSVKYGAHIFFSWTAHWVHSTCIAKLLLCKTFKFIFLWLWPLQQLKH